MSELKTHV